MSLLFILHLPSSLFENDFPADIGFGCEVVYELMFSFCLSFVLHFFHFYFGNLAGCIYFVVAADPTIGREISSLFQGLATSRAPLEVSERMRRREGGMLGE